MKNTWFLPARPFFNRDLKMRVASLEKSIEELTFQLKQINCKHKETENRYIFGYPYSRQRQEVCLNCNKVLRIFNKEIDYHKAQVKKLNEKLKAENAIIKVLNKEKK